MKVAPASKRTAKIRCEHVMEVERDFVFAKADGSDAATVGLYWTTPAAWRKHPYRDDPRWLATQIQANVVVAIRLDQQ